MEQTSCCTGCNAEPSREQPSLAEELDRLHEQVKTQAHLVEALRERLSGLLLPWPEEKHTVDRGFANCPYVEKMRDISDGLDKTTSLLARILSEAQV
jgi:hypothetical protein